MGNNSIDLQVNGYLGVDFSDVDLTLETCRKACASYLRTGADMFLPTVITSSQDMYKRNLAIIAEVISDDEFKGKIPGIHVEGPFLSPQPGAVGAHNPDWVVAPSMDYFNKLQEYAGGTIKLITIAAEIEGADVFCKQVTQTGVAVSLGHQLATYDDLDRLYNSGATLMTHLGNGMPNEVHRHTNTFLAGLSHPGLTAMIIADGHHLPSHIVQMIIRAKGVDKVVITSDAAPLAGLAPGRYHTLGNDVLLEESGLLHNPEKQCLVGSSFSLRKCISFLQDMGLQKQDIATMTVKNPAEAIDL